MKTYKSNMEEKFEKYMQNSGKEFLFHGSPKELDVLVAHQTVDSNGMAENIDNAIFLTSSFLMASAYAFKDTIKANSKGLNWDFRINGSEELPIMTMKNVRIDKNMTGYIYVVKNDKKFKNEPLGSEQFKFYDNLTPIDRIEVKYKDFEKYFAVEENENVKK